MLPKNQYFLVWEPDNNYSLVDKSDKGEPTMFAASSLPGNVHVAQASIPEQERPFSESVDKKYVVKFSPQHSLTFRKDTPGRQPQYGWRFHPPSDLSS